MQQKCAVGLFQSFFIEIFSSWATDNLFHNSQSVNENLMIRYNHNSESCLSLEKRLSSLGMNETDKTHKRC